MDINSSIINFLQQSNRGQQVQQQPGSQLGIGLTSTQTTQANTPNNDLQALLAGILTGTAANTSPPAAAAPTQVLTQQLLAQHQNPIQPPQQPSQIQQQLLVHQLLQASQPQPAAQVVQQQQPLLAQVSHQQQQAQLTQQLLINRQALPSLPAVVPTAPQAQLAQQATAPQIANNGVQVDGNLLLGIVQALSQLQGNTTNNNNNNTTLPGATPILPPPPQASVPDPPTNAPPAAAASAVLPPPSQPISNSTGGAVTTSCSKPVVVKKQSKKNKASASTLPPPPRPAKRSKSNHSHLVDNSNTRTALLYVPSDEDSISPYAAYARQQIEFFEAQEVDVSTGAQGRNKPVKLGQVGLRCIHCKHLHPKLRTRGAVYYPSRLGVLYQAAQNTVKTHLPELCESMPEDIRNKLLSLNTKRSSVGGGKHYWSAAAQIQGVIDTEEGLFFQKQDK